MNELFLSRGAHTTREDGMCAMEFGAYLAGLEHTDRPECVSPVLLGFMIRFNDSVDDKRRQQLRPYIVRTLGTAGDGQERARAFVAADWAVRQCTPMALEAMGLPGEAAALRRLNPVVDTGSAHAAAYAVADAAAHAGASADAADAAADAAAASDAAAYAAAYADAAAYGAGAAAARAAAYAATRAAAVWESALELLDLMIDPGGLHDVKSEVEWLALGRG